LIRIFTMSEAVMLGKKCVLTHQPVDFHLSV
jgi:hypothetical protein